MLDLNEFKTSLADTGAKMPVRHPVTDVEVEGVFVVLLGLDSDLARSIERKKAQRMIDRLSRGKGKAPALDADVLTAQAIDELVELTVSVEGLQMDGKEIGKDKALIRAAYEQYTWLADQAREFIGDRSNFFGKPKKG